MATSQPPQDAAPPHAAALSLLNELRAAFGFSVVREERVDDQLTRELREAQPLLTMLSAMLRVEPSHQRRDDVRANWQKAVRRRNWEALASLPETQASPSTTPPREDPVKKLLACFGVHVELRMGPLTTTHAEVLAAELLREVDVLRGLPLATPERYAARHRDIVERWNAFAERCAELPRIETQDD